MDGRHFCAVIAAGGQGMRMNAAKEKQLLAYKGSTVLECAIKSFLKEPKIESIVIVIPSESDNRPYVRIAANLSGSSDKEIRIATGGSSRGESVKNGLEEVRRICADKGIAADMMYVLIHDGARPDVTRAVIERNIDALSDADAVCTAVPAIDSMRSISNGGLHSELKYPIMKSKAINRENIYNVQTPQSFKLSTILVAYALAERDEYVGTDDASIAEYAGMEVALVEGDYANVKVTTGKDIPMNTRVGTGYDSHQLVSDRRLVLCGVPVPSNKGLLGHSDADVATHALMDSILGAAGKGDIGKHFPDDDEKYRDANSIDLLQETLKIAGDIRVVNADITIIAEAPKLAPYIDSMKKTLADALDVPVDAVNVKATTNEGMGFVGREEGIAAIATCQIEGRI